MIDLPYRTVLLGIRAVAVTSKAVKEKMAETKKLRELRRDPVRYQAHLNRLEEQRRIAEHNAAVFMWVLRTIFIVGMVVILYFLMFGRKI